MNRLLQGDVGSGKNSCWIKMAMLRRWTMDFRLCLDGATEILAQPHYISLQEMLEALPVKKFPY